jgi:[ribosomal protein S5]-alanine N-acetyltransferase
MEPAAPVEIRTERLALRLATVRDVPEIVRFQLDNRQFLAPYEPARSEEFFTERYWRAQVTASRREFREGRSLRLFLFRRAKKRRVVGYANFSNIVRGIFHGCHLGYSLAEDAQGQGYMREALQAGIRFVFDELGMHRIMANYMPHNRRSGYLLRRLGFTVEGYARDYLMINGRWEDHLLTSLVNPHWDPARIPARSAHANSDDVPGNR